MPGFRNVLIPVDFSDNTDIAVKKAIEICEFGLCRFHLFHVVLDKRFSFPFSFKTKKAVDKFEEKEAEKRLEEWKSCIEKNAPNIKVDTSIVWDGNILQCIAIKAKKIKADLIVIGKQVDHFWFPFFNTVTSRSIAKKTGCPVLTAKMGSLNSKIRNIVVPVNETLDQSKLNVIGALCEKRRIKIYLITFMNGYHVPENFSASSVLQLFQWLKTNLHCSVECAVLRGHNKAKAILNFSENQKADVLLLDLGSETKISWTGRHIPDALPPSSRMQVLTV